MPDSIREQIIKIVFDHAAELTACEVVRCRRTQELTKEPFVSVWDGQSTLVDRNYGAETKSFQIGIESIWLSEDKADSSEEVNTAMAEIEFHMSKLKEILGNLIKKFEWVSSQPFYPEPGIKGTGVQVNFKIEFSHALGDPYKLIT